MDSGNDLEGARPRPDHRGSKDDRGLLTRAASQKARNGITEDKHRGDARCGAGVGPAKEQQDGRQENPAARASEAGQETDGDTAENADPCWRIARFAIALKIAWPQQAGTAEKQNNSDQRPVVRAGKLHRTA